jgi:hypothetical protein
MRILLMTVGLGPGYAVMAMRMIASAKAAGYDGSWLIRSAARPGTDPRWERYAALQQPWIAELDWVIWSDADTVWLRSPAEVVRDIPQVIDQVLTSNRYCDPETGRVVACSGLWAVRGRAAASFGVGVERCRDGDSDQRALNRWLTRHRAWCMLDDEAVAYAPHQRPGPTTIQAHLAGTYGRLAVYDDRLRWLAADPSGAAAPGGDRQE